MLYMPVWTLDELQACRGAIYPTLPAGLLTKLFSIAGGIPRYVLETASDNLRGMTPEDVAEDMRSFVIEAVNKCQSLNTLISQAGTTDASDTVSHILIHIHPITVADDAEFDIDEEGEVVFAGRKLGG